MRHIDFEIGVAASIVDQDVRGRTQVTGHRRDLGWNGAVADHAIYAKLGCRRRATSGVDPATLDLLSVIRRAGPPYRLSTRQIPARALVTAGAISQRITRAEQAGLVARSPAADGSRAVR